MKDTIKKYWLFACWVAERLSFGAGNRIRKIHSDFIDTLREKTMLAVVGWLLVSLLMCLVGIFVLMITYSGAGKAGLDAVVLYFSVCYMSATVAYLVYCGLRAAWAAYQLEQSNLLDNLKAR